MDEETAEALTRTKALYDAGVLTEEEYNSKKNELLNPPPVVVAQPPAIVAQPPANEYGGVVQGHVVTEQPQKVHPEPRPQEDILAKRCECERRCECGIRPKRPTKKDGKPDYGFRWDGEVQKWVSNHRSNEESARAATLIQAKARRSAALKDYQLPPGATSATSLQGWWLGPAIGICFLPPSEIFPVGPAWCFKLEAHGHNKLMMTNQCGIPICANDCEGHYKFYKREKAQNVFKQVEANGEAGMNTLWVHNSFCATFFGCQWVCILCKPVTFRIPFSGPWRTALPEVAPAPSITVQPGLAVPPGEQEQVKYAAEPEAYSSPHN